MRLCTVLLTVIKLEIPKKHVQFRNLRKTESLEFVSEISRINWHDFYNASNVDVKMNILTIIIKHCPPKTSISKRSKPPWLRYLDLKKL